MGRWVWEFDLFKKLGVMGNLTLLFLSIAKACYISNAYQIVHIHVVCVDTPSTTYSGLRSVVFQLLLLCTICSPKFVFLLRFFLKFGPSLSCIHWWSWIGLRKCITSAPAIMLSRWSAARLTYHSNKSFVLSYMRGCQLDIMAFNSLLNHLRCKPWQDVIWCRSLERPNP